jgi:hypothetical protein
MRLQGKEGSLHLGKELVLKDSSKQELGRSWGQVGSDEIKQLYDE